MTGPLQPRQTLTVRLPLHVASRTNARGHWTAAARRTKAERGITAMHLAPLAHRRPNVDGGVVVRLVRVGPRALDDDNLRDAFKAIRDEVAKWLGVDDRDPRVRWAYAQCSGARRVNAVDIEITAGMALAGAP